MVKSNIRVFTHGQRLGTGKSVPHYAGETIHYIGAHFDLDESWEGYDSVRAVWWNGAVEKATVFDATMTCIIPLEVVAKKGYVMVNLIASVSENGVLTDRFTSYPFKVAFIDADVKLTGSETVPVTPSQFEQFVEVVKNDADKAYSEADRAMDEADRAEQAADGAEASATAAEASATDAEAAKTATLAAKGAAETAEGNAETAATQAAESATTASGAASTASQKAGEASTYASNAGASASQAQTYASNAEQSATAASGSASAAETAAESAKQSATDAGNYVGLAEAAETAAGASATSAEASATSAAASATQAQESATQAAQKATEASQSATNAQGYAQTAEQAKTSAQTAQGLAESARDSAVSAKDDAESARDDAVQAKEDAESAVASISGALDDKAPVITDTASGAVASFADGADDLPLKSLVVDINPVQDLHGQDAPYPAGGGVNKFKYNASVGTQIINGVTWTLYEDGSIQVSGTASGASTFRYVLAERVEDDDFYFSGNYKFYAFPANISTEDFQGGVKIGSNWYSVYANGYSIALNNADGKIVEAWFQVRVDKTVNATIRPMIYPESESTPTAWSPYENICPISGWTQINVNHSDADTTNPTTITINLGQTVYGGKLDVLSGELTVDRAIVDLGTLNWTNEDSYLQGMARAAVGVTDLGAVYFQTPLCSTLKGTSPKSYLQVEMGTVCFSNSPSTPFMRVRSQIFSGLSNAEIKTALTGVQFVYELAAPITIQLTPHEVNSLLGVNNIFADTGDCAVEYRADTKLYIDKKLTTAIANALNS